MTKQKKKNPSRFAKPLTISLSFTPDDSEKKIEDTYVVCRPLGLSRLRWKNRQKVLKTWQKKVLK